MAGTRRYILDYLLEGVLNYQPDALQHFLMGTAILDRLCTSIWDALTGCGEATSQEILPNLERANLFIIPLDDKRTWYRYHDLLGSPEESPETGAQVQIWQEIVL